MDFFYYLPFYLLYIPFVIPLTLFLILYFRIAKGRSLGKIGYGWSICIQKSVGGYRFELCGQNAEFF